MAATGFFHHIGTFLLFVSFILLLITSISAPVINDIGLLRVNLNNGSAVSFGSFGYCVLNAQNDANVDYDYCTHSKIGYNPALEMAGADHTVFNNAATNTSKGLTRVMVLHPVACALSFIAFLLAIGSGIFGALLASMFSFLAFVVTLVVMATDFTSFGIVKNHVNGSAGSGQSHASFSVAMWLVLASMILLFIATFVVLLSCCSARRHKRQGRVSKHEAGYANGTTTTTKRRFWQRKHRY